MGIRVRDRVVVRDSVRVRVGLGSWLGLGTCGLVGTVTEGQGCSPALSSRVQGVRAREGARCQG